MKSLKPLEIEFWQKYLARLSNPERLNEAKITASMAGNKEIADILLNLYLEGKKTAGSGLVKDYEFSGDPLPALGNYWIILDTNEQPRCIVKTVRVELHLFREVPPQVAIAEGEGDLSLEYWREAHILFFQPYLAKLGIEDLDEAEVVTEFFSLVYKSESEK
jgi:uncharacterized protein YhfF